MKIRSKIDPALMRDLYREMPSLRPQGLESMWFASENWVMNNVAKYHYARGAWPTTFETVVFLRVLSLVCYHNTRRRHSLEFAMHELLRPYKD